LTRTIWLGFSFLIFLAAVASFRFAFGHFDLANAQNLARPNGSLANVGSTALQGTLTNADRLPTASIGPPIVAKAIPTNDLPKLAAQRPSTVVPPRIISRHWRLLNAGLIRQARERKANRKYAKADGVGIPSKAAAETSNCHVEGLDAIRRALKLSTGCPS